MKKGIFIVAMAVLFGFAAARATEVVLRLPDEAGGQYVRASSIEAEVYLRYVADKAAATVFQVEAVPDSNLVSLYLWAPGQKVFLHLECDDAGALVLIPDESILAPKAGDPWAWRAEGGLVLFGEGPLAIRLVVEVPPCKDGRVLRTM